MGKKDVANQIKKLVEEGDYVGAQALITSLATPPVAKKRGRPSKPKSLPSVSLVEKKIMAPQPSCVASSRRTDASPRTFEKDGKTYTYSRSIGWTPPEKIKFTDDKKVARNEMGLHYPERSPRRNPAKEVPHICHLCDKKVMAYPTVKSGEDMLYTCPQCLKRRKSR